MQKRKVPVRSNATVASARNCILGRITGRTTPLELIELSEQYRKVYTLLEQTVSEGEANSVLLLGSRGTGKTAVVRKALQALRQKFTPRPLPPTEGGQEEGGQPQTGKTFFEVYLNGLFHTDDRLALREIIRQLHLEQQLDDQQLGSFAECLAFVLNTLSAGSKESTPVIFVLDEIDLFAQHPKQALLYNLFDIAQSSQNPIAVVGLTCRMDFIYLLEKRVKSRFSHRHVYFHPPQTIGQFEQVLQATLCLSPEDPVKEPYYVTEFNKAVQAVLRQPEIQTILKETFELNKDVRTLLRIFYGAVIRLSILSPFLTAGSVLESAVRQRLDQKMEIIQSLSMLELCLLIAMKQQESRQVEAFNFEMVYDDYRDFVQKANSYGGGVRSLFFVKPVAFKAFEHLLSLEMMKPIDGAGVQCPKEHRMVRLLLSSQQIEMGVKAYKECPEAVVRWYVLLLNASGCTGCYRILILIFFNRATS
ncbi:origin recognition complex subunit 4 [Gaertneriomyces semiglobifer]|nr:origin recognition complex subunit 4 [Gaertneriomyces semiglobifer]